MPIVWEKVSKNVRFVTLTVAGQGKTARKHPKDLSVFKWQHLCCALTFYVSDMLLVCIAESAVEAERLCREVLEYRQNFHKDPAHAAVLESTHNLAMSLQDQGELHSLFYKDVKVVSAFIPYAGKYTTGDHSQFFFIAPGKLEEAEGLSRRAMGARERVLGANHPSTLNAKVHLAELLAEQGDLCA